MHSDNGYIMSIAIYGKSGLSAASEVKNYFIFGSVVA
jgi:hypothetical protein